MSGVRLRAADALMRWVSVGCGEKEGWVNGIARGPDSWRCGEAVIYAAGGPDHADFFWIMARGRES
jgi:hypothetical protein